MIKSAVQLLAPLVDILIEDIAAHEIGHVLQGPEWYDLMRGTAEAFPYFDGFNAKDQFRFLLAQGKLNYKGVMVPVINDRTNVDWTHWYSRRMSAGRVKEGQYKGRYSYFAFEGDSYGGQAWGAEIMSLASGITGEHDSISRVTLGALKDLGYPVDMSKAEYYRFSRIVSRTDPFDPEDGWEQPSPKPVATHPRCGVGLGLGGASRSPLEPY